MNWFYENFGSIQTKILNDISCNLNWIVFKKINLIQIWLNSNLIEDEWCTSDIENSLWIGVDKNNIEKTWIPLLFILELTKQIPILNCSKDHSWNCPKDNLWNLKLCNRLFFFFNREIIDLTLELLAPPSQARWQRVTRNILCTTMGLNPGSFLKIPRSQIWLYHWVITLGLPKPTLMNHCPENLFINYPKNKISNIVWLYDYCFSQMVIRNWSLMTILFVLYAYHKQLQF
jgi:hypothetical protein